MPGLERADTQAAMQQQLANELRSLMEAFKTLTGEMHQSAIQQAIMRGEFCTMKEALDTFSRTFRDGPNGGVLGKLAIMEVRLDRLSEQLEDLVNRQTLQADADRLEKTEMIRRNRDASMMMWTAVISGGLGFLGSVIAGAIALWHSK